jgi:flagellar operon protein
MIDFNGVSVPFIPAGGVERFKKSGPAPVQPANGGTPFREIFEEEIGKVKFSGHALSRMTSREMNLTDNEILRLENAVQKAELKNSRDSLVLLDEKAFLVNVPNRTVITMFTKDKLGENVITKIDSAVFA